MEAMWPAGGWSTYSRHFCLSPSSRHAPALIGSNYTADLATPSVKTVEEEDGIHLQSSRLYRDSTSLLPPAPSPRGNRGRTRGI